MKIMMTVCACFLLGVSPARAGQAQSQADKRATASAAKDSGATVSQGTIDRQKEADIRRLLDVVGTSALMNQTMTNMEHSLRPLLESSLPPGDYRDRLITLFFEKFHSKLNLDVMMHLAVVRYDENYSDEEIRGLIAFYETPLGRKVTLVTPKLANELQHDGQALGQKIGQDSMSEVLAEHPDLARAMGPAGQH